MWVILGRLDMEPNIPAMVGSYGASKAALNLLVRRTHFENPWPYACCVKTGFVQTDNGNATAQVFDMPNATHTLEQSVAGLLEIVFGATRDKTLRKSFNFNGSEIFSWSLIVKLQ